MQVGSQWYNRIATEISQYELTLGPKDFKKYRLDLLRRLAKRIDDFAPSCGECQTSQSEITGMMQDLNMLTQMPSKQGLKLHSKAVTGKIEHLKKTHKLVEKGHYMGIGIGIGLAIGAAIGTALREITDIAGAGTGAGIAIGVAIGAYLDKKAEKEGRVI